MPKTDKILLQYSLKHSTFVTNLCLHGLTVSTWVQYVQFEDTEASIFKSY
jgi:hypothetical protein